MTRFYILLVQLTIALAAEEDVTVAFSGTDNSVEGVATEEQPIDVDTEYSLVNKTSLTDNEDSALGAASLPSIPRFYNLTSPLKRGATLKDEAALVSAESGAQDVIVRRKRTFHKKTGAGGGCSRGCQRPQPVCNSCGSGHAGGGGGSSSFAQSSSSAGSMSWGKK